jgi:hypothetical protein
LLPSRAGEAERWDFSSDIFMLETVLIGVASSFTASLLFIIFLYRLRPRIVISPDIAKEAQPNCNAIYTFKVANRTRYPVIDFKLELILLTPANLPNGTCSQAKILSKLERFELESGTNPTLDNELFFAYRGPLEQECNDDSQQLMIAVIAKLDFRMDRRVYRQTRPLQWCYVSPQLGRDEFTQIVRDVTRVLGIPSIFVIDFTIFPLVNPANAIILRVS